MSRVISVRLKDDEHKHLERAARKFGRTRGETAALLLREKLREEEFPVIEFRDTIVGRQVYVKGTRVQIWMVVLIARDYDMDPQQVADHLKWPLWQVQSALAYADVYRDEIDPIVEEVESFTFEDLKRIVPAAELFTFDQSETTRLAGRSEPGGERSSASSLTNT